MTDSPQAGLPGTQGLKSSSVVKNDLLRQKHSAAIKHIIFPHIFQINGRHLSFPVKRRHPRYTKLFAAPQILYHVRKFRICPDLGSKRKASHQLSVPRTGCRAEIQK